MCGSCPSSEHARRRTVQTRRRNHGTGIATAGLVTNFFMVGAERITWEIITISEGGPYRLSVFHPRGTIVEYFTTTAAAVKREQEIETLLLASTTSQATVGAS